MKYDCDVIVVGAGNGGLTAANEVASKGYKVILFDKHNLPGGVATSFVRGRFEFEASLHELCDVGTEEMPGSVRKLFERLNCGIDFYNEMTLFRTIVKGENGYDVSIKAGKEDFASSMLECCPECGKSLDKLYKLLESTTEALAYNDKKHGKPNKLVMLMRYSGFLISASHPLDDVLISLGFEDKARSVLETYWSYLGVPANELNAFHYFEMMRGYIRGGAGIPAHKSYSISLALADRALKNNCELRLGCEVTKFIFENDKVIGVEAGGDTYYAKEIISNIIPHNFANLAGSENIKEKDKRLLNARKFGISFLCIYLGLDVTAEELGLNYTTFISGSYFSDRKILQTKYPDIYVVNCLNAVVPDATPEGSSSLFITVPVIPSYFMEGVNAGNYKDFKNDAALKYIKDCEKTLGVDIISHIEEISVATPVTFARYFASPDGTAYGYELSRWDGIIARMLDKINRFSYDKLTFCGGHGASGDGYGVTYLSGIEAAEKVASKLRKAEFIENIKSTVKDKVRRKNKEKGDD